MATLEQVKKNLTTLARGIPKSPTEFIHSMRLLGELRHFGWQDTLASDSWSHDKAPPHLTYGAISFLDRVVNLDSQVLEWGSGTSTAFFCERAAHVTSIEHDRGWSERLPRLENHTLKLARVNSANSYRGSAENPYSQLALGLGQFDIILIDGLARIDCAYLADQLLAPHGLVVLDDLHDPQIAEAQTHLESTMEGFEFWGVRPYSGAWGGTGIYSPDFGKTITENLKPHSKKPRGPR